MEGKKLAVLVGCNYPNTKYELHGCINDVLAMHESLVTHFGFNPRDIVILTDDEASSVTVHPTGANIKKALERMVDSAEPGDVLFFHYSGHGTLIPSPSPKMHPFRQDEAIVPCDFNLVTDIDFRQLTNRVPKGATFTILSDSCHSGGLIHKEKEQIGPSTATTSITSTISKAEHINTSSKLIYSHTPKMIPFESVLGHIASLTNINHKGNNEIHTHFLELFGSDSSLRFQYDPQVVSDMESELQQVDEGILLSGCQKYETCADVRPTENGVKKKAYGAFSYAIETVFKDNNMDSSSRSLSNKELVFECRKVLQLQHNVELQQHPCLYCSDENANKNFLGQSLEYITYTY